MSASTLVLVRHGAIECSGRNGALLCGTHDAALSCLGHRQVEQLRVRLERQGHFAALYTSPLRRALDTAQAAPDTLRHTLRRVRSLQEIHCGMVEGMAIEDIRRTWRGYWQRNEQQADEDFAWPGGESYRVFRKRVLRAVSAIARMHPGQEVLIFTHAGVVNQILGTIAGQSAAKWENFRPGNTAITEVLWSGASGRVLRFDDGSHLS